MCCEFFMSWQEASEPGLGAKWRDLQGRVLGKFLWDTSAATGPTQGPDKEATCPSRGQWSAMGPVEVGPQVTGPCSAGPEAWHWPWTWHWIRNQGPDQTGRKTWGPGVKRGRGLGLG